MMDTKIIAMYLPQYHCIPENDLFWGKGFTDWTTVRKAKPLFEDHNQPRIPLNDNYYDLSIEENVIWQAKLAKEYGIYGFGIYHYWFNNEKNILTTPTEIFRDSDRIDLHYYLAWDNASWKRSWSNVEGNDWAPLAENRQDRTKGPAILIPYIPGGEEDWKKHYTYLLEHFKSPKYIKMDNKPMFTIFNYDETVGRMCSYWDELARHDGFEGIYFVIKQRCDSLIPDSFHKFKYEPLYSGWPRIPLSKLVEMKICKLLGIHQRVRRYDYDKVWKKIIANAKHDVDSNIYHSAFVSYDDTPRRGYRGVVVKGNTPLKFAKYMKQLLAISSEQDKPFVFLTAWNEWGEGAYLEPDSKNQYDYLKAIKH